MGIDYRSAPLQGASTCCHACGATRGIGTVQILWDVCGSPLDTEADRRTRLPHPAPCEDYGTEERHLDGLDEAEDVLDELREVGMPGEPPYETLMGLLAELDDAEVVLDALREFGKPDDPPYETLMGLLGDLRCYATVEDRLRPYARVGEAPVQTFGRLMDGMTGFLRGVAGL